MRTSYSAIQTYNQCPQKFKFQVLDKIPSKPSPEATFGNSVHSALNYMFSRSPVYPTMDEILSHFSEKWKSASIKLPDLAIQLKDTYEESGKKLIKEFHKKNPPWNFSTVDTESHFEVLLPDPENGQNHVLAGIIDRIDKIGEGSYEIIDYKTGRRLPSQDRINSDLQLSVYHLALLKRWPHVKAADVKLSLYFLKHAEKLSSSRTMADLEETKKTVLKTIRDIQGQQAENNFPAIPSPLCEYCPYKQICPAWKHLYKKTAASAPNESQLQQALQEYFAIKSDDNKNKKRLSELQGIITAYMEAYGLDRVFDDRGYYISQKLQQRFKFDFEQIKAILCSAGLEEKWSQLLEADEKKLKIILKELPPELQVRIMEQKTLSKEFKVLVASSKPVKK
ncbi:PD-(D/E)XK nuclease family protein [Candidatus Giovannonibacteria bacterium]|nr:PD-(D/E)XK nuclease family protein [Candidatus Giovannonibacteria bacterium]